MPKELRTAIIAAVATTVVGGALEWLTGAVSAQRRWMLDVGVAALAWFSGPHVVFGWLLAPVLLLAAIGALHVLPRWRRRPEWETQFVAMDHKGARWS